MKTAEEILKEYGNWNKEGLAEWHKDCIIAAMEEYAQQQVKNLNIPAVMVRSEQLPCSHCGRPLIEHSKETKLCPDRMKNYEQGN